MRIATTPTATVASIAVRGRRSLSRTRTGPFSFTAARTLVAFARKTTSARRGIVCARSGAPDAAPPFGEPRAQAPEPGSLRLRRSVVPAGHQRRALGGVVEGGRRSNRPSTVLQAGKTGSAG